MRITEFNLTLFGNFLKNFPNKTEAFREFQKRQDAGSFTCKNEYFDVKKSSKIIEKKLKEQN
jgi:hypothetical protein